MSYETSAPPEGGDPPAMPGRMSQADEAPGGSETALEFWQTFGFSDVVADNGTIRARVPADTVMIQPTSDDGHRATTAVLIHAGVQPKAVLRHTVFATVMYRIPDASVAARLTAEMPEGVVVSAPGDIVELPCGDAFDPAHCSVAHVAELTTLTFDTAVQASDAQEDVPSTNPFLPFSLRGSAGSFEDRAKEAKPLLGDICLSGQATVWYAPPNAGKTLLALNLTVQAVRQGRITAGHVFYVNADDNSAGLAAKLRILDDLGAHTLVPGFKGFKAGDLAISLRRSAETDEAQGMLVIIDTVKKFASLMDKRESSTFADACRQFVMRGGSVLALAHTTKNPNADGKLRYSGTTDLIEDLDAAYVLTPFAADGEAGERFVQFTMLKRRADNPETAAYAYAGETGITYDERLASVRSVDVTQLDTFKRVIEQKSDAELIAAVGACITGGIIKKMDLAKASADRAGISERAAIRIIEKYTGNDPALHRWRFSVKDRGAKLFEMLPAAAP